MNRFFLWPGVLAALALNACASLGTHDHRFPSSMARQSHGLKSAPPTDTTKACARWRWIGISSATDGSCPDLAGWTGQFLFPRLARTECGSNQVPGPDVYEALERFCVYEPTDPDKKLPAMACPLPPSSGLVRLDQDCVAVSPAGELEAATWESMQERFFEGVGWNGVPAPAMGNRPGVRLAFLDTQPTGTGVPDHPGRTLHGFAMAHLANRLLCEPGKPCAAKITTRLAMPIVEFDAEDPRKTLRDPAGGFWGSPADLATAITDEVDSWLREDPELRLVLNLSLAWDPRVFGGMDEKWVAEMNAGAQAVYHALRYARGHGALVVAAAGNHRNGPGPATGPLLPAGWESRAPEFAGCGETPAGPLVYAAAGVQSNGHPLANAREGGIPPRVAYADHAAVACHGADKPIGTYTGSSVAAAVVSSIASAVWQKNPTLDARGVMKALQYAGEKLSYPADFGEGVGVTTEHSVRLVSLCRALGLDCSDGPQTESVRVMSDLPDRNRRILAEPSDLRLLEGHEIPYPCRAARIYQMDGENRLLCPAAQLYDRTSVPLTHPEPEDNPCPNCLIAAAPGESGSLYILHIEVAEDWRRSGDCPVPASLTVDTDTGSIVRPLEVSRFDCDEGPYQLELGELPDAKEWRAVSLTWTVGNGLSKQSPVLIVDPSS